MSRAYRRAVPVVVAAGFLGVGLVVVQILDRYGSTRTTVTQTGQVTQTTAESNAVALAVVTGLIALASAALTAFVGQWYAAAAERDRRAAEAFTARATRVREQVAAVAAGIAAMLEEVRPLEEDGARALGNQRAVLWGTARHAVRKAANAALPDVGVVHDADLREAAQTVFDTHATWYADAEQAARAGDPEPDRAPRQASLDAFFARARAVIEDVERISATAPTAAASRPATRSAST